MFLIILFVSGLIGVAISAIFMAAGDTGMKIAQGLSSIFMFVVPPIVYYYVTRMKHQMYDLGFRKPANPWWLLLIGVVLMFISLPVTNQLTRWNEAMSFGGVFEKLEEYLKMLEETAAATTEKMLNVDTIGGLLLNLLVIALIPAVGEELTFRGVLQQGLMRRVKSPHVAHSPFPPSFFSFYFSSVLLGFPLSPFPGGGRSLFFTVFLWVTCSISHAYWGQASPCIPLTPARLGVYIPKTKGPPHTPPGSFGERSILGSSPSTAWWRRRPSPGVGGGEATQKKGVVSASTFFSSFENQKT